MITALPLLIALILDALLGEPRVLWDRVSHPAILMGQAVAWCDRRLNFGSTRRIKGVITLLILTLSALLIGLVLMALPGQIIDVVILTILLAQKSLAQHVTAVASALRLSLGDGRKSVAMIVGRDTADMLPDAVARSAIESAAENLSDGVIAPAFWFLIGGLPGLLVYKITNTADSMIGYKTEKYRDFGWAAARFDDLLNLAPARLAALMIAPFNWQSIAKDAKLHRSPNAGWPEAAMAQTLDIALSGPRSYDGEMRNFPFVNPRGRRMLAPNDIDDATHILWRTWAIALAATAILALL